MKMTLPFKPHVLALICSAGLCAASTGLYIKSRTVEAPVEPQSTQLAVSDAAAVTFPATVSAPPVTPAVVKSAFSTAQIDQWVAPVALYPDALLSQVLMASTYPTNVAQAVQWSHDNPLKQGDAAIQAVSDQPWDASVKSLVAFPQLMALMGENPQWVQNLGRCFSGPAAGRDGLGTAIAATGATNRLAEVINRTESYYHNEESCTGKTDSHGTRHTIQYSFNCQPRHYRAGNNRHFH